MRASMTLPRNAAVIRSATGAALAALVLEPPIKVEETTLLT